MIPLFIDSTIPPLTRAGKNGEVYFRRPEVLEQIESLRDMTEEELFRRVAVRQEEEDHSLKSETLVFLIRCLRRNFPGALFNHLDNIIATTLNERIARIIGPLKTHFKEDHNREDSYSDFRLSVVSTFYCKACEENSNAADYAEVSFGQFIIGLARNELKKYFNLRTRMALFQVLETQEEMESALRSRGLFSRDIHHIYLDVLDDVIEGAEITENFTERAALLRSALNVLPEPSRTAWFLRYGESWEIESKDESVPTLARFFKVSGRTIRNWLSNAEEILNTWRTTSA